MKSSRNAQYTIRGVPERLDTKLRDCARREGKSLNVLVIETLMRGTGVSDEPVVHHDLDDLAGTWAEDPEFDKAIQEMDQVDMDLWK